LGEGTPYSFVLVDIKLIVFLEQMDKLYVLSDLILCMSKGAEAFILAFVNIVGIKLAKFCFVSIGMIQLL
jgi:hypothetical protein